MQSKTRRFIAIVGMSLGLLILRGMAVAGTDPFEGLSVEWWQWVFSIPASDNPLADATGAHCMVGQRGDVWFLVGNGGGTTTRTCTIPEGVELFFPVVNQSFFDSPNACGQGDFSVPVSEMRAFIAAFIDGVTITDVTVDGKPVKDIDRIQSKIFAIALPDDNIAGGAPGCPAGIYSPTVDDGYYVQLKPLKVGTHTLHFHAENPSAGFTLDVTYHLDVVPVVKH